jgi:hypothetical protein
MISNVSEEHVLSTLHLKMEAVCFFKTLVTLYIA